MTRCISKEENQALNIVLTLNEIKTTLFSMQDLKAPSPDRFPTLFYKEFWPIIEDTVTCAVTFFFTMDAYPRMQTAHS